MKNYDKYIKQRAGTSFRGYLLATYQQLCSVFGEPADSGEGYKIDVEWIIHTPHGIATVYNYKNGRAYLGENGIEIAEICEWHVGGKNDQSYIWTKQKLESEILRQL